MARQKPTENDIVRELIGSVKPLRGPTSSLVALKLQGGSGSTIGRNNVASKLHVVLPKYDQYLEWNGM